jgi:hypothetical protein
MTLKEIRSAIDTCRDEAFTEPIAGVVGRLCTVLLSLCDEIERAPVPGKSVDLTHHNGERHPFKCGRFARSLGLDKIHPVRAIQIIDLAEAGYSDEEIARVLGSKQGTRGRMHITVIAGAIHNKQHLLAPLNHRARGG